MGNLHLGKFKSFYHYLLSMLLILAYKEPLSQGSLHTVILFKLISFLKKDFIYLFLERGREREIEGEKHQCVVAPCVHPTRDLACNPGMSPDWESNQ